MKKIILLFLFFQNISVGFSQNFSFEWAKSWGNDFAYDVAVDASGNVYTTGLYSGTIDFDPGTAVFNLTSNTGSFDVFVSKFDASGNFIWAKSMGGAGFEISYGIAVDATGNVYTTGKFEGTADFDPSATVFNLVTFGGDDVFISKLDANGNFVWAQKTGGPTSVDEDWGRSIFVDASSNVYVTGYFSGTSDFDPGTGTANLTSSGGKDIFVLKLDSNGGYVWARKFGDIIDDIGLDITVDALGNVYTIGVFNGTVDFDPGITAAFNLIDNGDGDAFISKLDVNGDFVWAKSFGGLNYAQGERIALDALGNVYTTGVFNGTADFDPSTGTFSITALTGEQAFVNKLDASGNFVWAKTYKATDGNSASNGSGIAIDNNLGYVYTAGHFFGICDFDPGNGSYKLSAIDNTDLYITKLDLFGNFLEAKSMGDVNTDYCPNILTDNSSNFYAVGRFEGTTDFDPTNNIYNLSTSIASFVLKWKNCASYILTSSITDASDPYMNDGQVTVASNGNAPYTFLWDTHANNQTTATATALYPKEYCVTVTNAPWTTGCPSNTNVHCVRVGSRPAFWRDDRYMRYNNFQGNVPSVNHPIQARFSIFDQLTSDTLWCNTYEKTTNNYGSFNFRLGYELDAPNPISTTCVNPPSINNVGPNPFDSCASASTQYIVGTNNISSAFPYRGFWQDGRVQILYRASDLIAAGLNPGLISSLAFNITTKASTQPYSNFSIKMDTTSLNQFLATQSFLADLVPVYYNPALTTTVGWNNYNLNTTFEWDGISNLVVEVCFDNIASTLDDSVQAQITSYPSTLEFEADNEIGCSAAAEAAGTNRPLIRFSNCHIAATEKDFFNLPWATGNKWMRVQYEDTIGHGFPYSWNIELASQFYALTSSYAERIPHWFFESKYTVAHSGNVNVYGSMGTYAQNTPSDLRYKKGITTIPNAWASLTTIRGVKYQYKPEAFEKDKQPSTDTQIGLIAQEVEKIYPEMVQTNSTGYKTVDYTKLTPVLLEAIKERQTRIEKIQADNVTRKEAIEELKKLNASTGKLLESIEKCVEKK